MADGKSSREALTEAVRELRAEVAALRAERDAHHCHAHGLCCSHSHCNWGHYGCPIVHGYTFGTPAYPVTWTVTTSTGNASAPQIQTFSTSN